MEGIKSDRPPWIQKLEKQFALDLKNNILLWINFYVLAISFQYKYK